MWYDEANLQAEITAIVCPLLVKWPPVTPLSTKPRSWWRSERLSALRSE
jgi:hypothetical protein